VNSCAGILQATPQVSIGKVYVQPDATAIGQYVLAVQGTVGDDHIQISTKSNRSRIEVKIDNLHLDQIFPLAQISRMQIYGQSGSDLVESASDVTLPTMIFSGDCKDDHIQTGCRVGPSDLAGTMFHHLGMNPNASWIDPQGRPRPIVTEGGRVIEELV
jgi:hypothetical protein